MILASRSPAEQGIVNTARRSRPLRFAPACLAFDLFALAASLGSCAQGNDDGGPLGSVVDDAGGGAQTPGDADHSAYDAPGVEDADSVVDVAGRKGLDATGSSEDALSPNDADAGAADGQVGVLDAGAADADAAAGNADASAADGSADATGGMDAAVEASAPADSSAEDAPCAYAAVTDYCTTIPALSAPPLIDGVLDCGPVLATMTAEGWTGTPPLPSGNSASIAAGWRPDGLYVFVAVTTPAVIPADPGTPPFDGAGVEIFVDSNGMYPNAPQYDDPGAIQLVAEAPGAGASSAAVGEGYRNAVDQGPWASTQFATFPTASGFVLEAFVAAADLGLASWSLASGAQVGFDVAVDVSYTSAATTGAQGHRAGQYYLNVGVAPIGPPYDDPRAFCTSTAQ